MRDDGETKESAITGNWGGEEEKGKKKRKRRSRRRRIREECLELKTLAVGETIAGEQATLMTTEDPNRADQSSRTGKTNKEK